MTAAQAVVSTTLTDCAECGRTNCVRWFVGATSPTTFCEQGARCLACGTVYGFHARGGASLTHRGQGT